MLFFKKSTLKCRNCRQQFLDNTSFLHHVSLCKKEETKIEIPKPETTLQTLSSIDENVFTFGKYKGQTLDQILLKRDYCKWLLKQEWFREGQPYLYNRIKEYDPKVFFLKPIQNEEKEENQDIHYFLRNFEWFHTIPTKKLEIKLSDDHRKCYKFYRKEIDKIKKDIEDNLSFNVKAPTGWLKNFEDKYNINREVFKDFLHSYELPNITTIIETIKERGGFEYKGAKSFKIAKERSVIQEKFWEEILKEQYGEEVSAQLPFDLSRFDFIRLKAKIIYECKLNLRDFNEEQYQKYKKASDGVFSIIYLIDKDCIIDIDKKSIFTTDREKYKNYFKELKKYTLFDELIKEFQIIKLEKIKDYF